VAQRRLRERSWEWSRLLLVCGAIAVLWLWQLGQIPLTPGEALPVDQAQQWLERLSSLGFNSFNDLEGLGKSPLTVALIALGQSLWGDSMASARLPITLMNILSLPLLYGLGKTLYGKSIPALLAVVVYGTALGVMYWARLATRNGLLLPLTLLLLTSLLFCRRDLRGSLALGLSLTAVGLTDLGTAVILAASGLIFLRWDTPRLLRTPVFWIGLGLGLLPAIAWWGNYDWHQGWLNGFFALIDGRRTSGWIWIFFSFPGLIFAATGFQQAKYAQHWSWARFLLCQGGVYSLFVILAPWSSGPLIMPLFAPLSLAAAVSLAEAYHPSQWVYPAWWRQVFLISAGLLFLAAIAVYWQGERPWPDSLEQVWLLLLLALLAMTLMMTAILLNQQKPEFITVLFWGLFVCLIVALSTPLWSEFWYWIDQWPRLSPTLIMAHHHLGA